MVNSRAASRYVKSLLDLAIERKVLDQVHTDMLLFSKTVEENRSFGLMLRNPIIRHEKKRAILQSIFKSKVNPLTMAMLDILTVKNREPLLPLIAKEFHNAYNLHKGIVKATITTAVPLDDKLRAEFERMVKSMSTLKQVEIIEKTDPEIIGGFVLKVGDRQIDASLQSKLKTLKLNFSKNPYIKEM